MRKKMVISIFVMLFAVCEVYAQRVVDVRRVEPVVNNKYAVMLDTVRVEVAPLVYKIIEANPTAYCAIELDGEKSFFRRAALDAPEVKYIFEVAGVGMENDMPTVSMTNGYRFSDPDLRWLAVLQGQHVQISRYVGLTHELMIFETVSRSTPLTEGVSGSDAMAPMKSRLPQMIGEVQDAAAKAKLTAQATPVATASAVTGASTITFGRK